MTVPTTEQYLAAKQDNDLLARLIAKAELMKVPNASDWVHTHLLELIQVDLTESDTIVTVYAYAAGVRKEYLAATPPAPGANLGAVTDTHLEIAIGSVLNPPTPPAEEPAS